MMAYNFLLCVISLLVVLFCWLVVFAAKTYNKRLKTINVKFDRFEGGFLPVIHVTKKGWFKSGRRERVKLSSLWCPNSENEAFMISKLENASRIEVDYRPSQRKEKGGLILGEVFVDDVSFNYECLKTGRADYIRPAEHKSEVEKFRKASNLAKKKSRGIFSQGIQLSRRSRYT